ncbi:MAG TPA: hypothetical protein VGX76_11960, partial [Pirellulales bacterium]|nr:hypothetical protein [Pirellulales bacterium]
QSGKTDSILAGTGRSTGETPPSFDLESGEAGGTLNHEDVGRLVAVGDTTAGWAAAFWAAGSRALGGEGDAGAIEFALHELLAPRFAFDSAALGEAIRDLVAEADEMGINLLGFLTDPTQRGEMALVAGVATALAYRHWRSGERREQAESRAMLAARFVRGPASLRLARRSPR